MSTRFAVWWLNLVDSQVFLLLGEGALYFILVAHRPWLLAVTRQTPIELTGLLLTVTLYLMAGLVAGDGLRGAGHWFGLLTGLLHWSLWLAIAVSIGLPVNSSHWALVFTSEPLGSAFVAFTLTMIAVTVGGWLSSS